MSERDWYKSEPESVTTLILGEVFKDRPPITTAVLFGQRAYEGYQSHAYMEALLRIRKEPGHVDWSPLFCALYAGILATGATQVIEIGSTLFATIDKLDKLSKMANLPRLDLEYIGVEPSEFLRDVADAIHPDSNIRYVEQIADIEPGPVSVGRCYQSTSYSYSTVEELIDYCSMTKFTSQGIWFSDGPDTVVKTILGKSLTLFSLPDFVKGMNERGFRVEFVAADSGAKLDQYGYFEVWLICHKFTEAEDFAFRGHLEKLAALTGEVPTFYADFASVPKGVRKDAAFDGRVSSGVMDFTSKEALNRLAGWRQSNYPQPFVPPTFAQRVVNRLKRAFAA